MRVLAKVKRMLQTHPEDRSSDKRRLLDVWELEGLGLSDTQRRIFMDKCTTPESVTRARRLLKEEYPPTDEVDQRRYELFQQHQAKMWDEVM
jgi:hypothetical protein